MGASDDNGPWARTWWRPALRPSGPRGEFTQSREAALGIALVSLLGIGGILVFSLNQFGIGWDHWPWLLGAGLAPLVLTPFAVIGRPTLRYDSEGLSVWRRGRCEMVLAWESVDHFVTVQEGDDAIAVGWHRRVLPGQVMALQRLSDEVAGKLPSTFGLGADRLAAILNARLKECRR